jgi:hypothetical protein
MNTIKVEIEKRLPSELFQVLACIGFWNEQGANVYEMNKAGKMGGKTSQEEARKLPYETFCLNSLINEIRTFAESKEQKYWPTGYKAGKAGDHIWVSDANNIRVLFIHF